MLVESSARPQIGIKGAIKSKDRYILHSTEPCVDKASIEMKIPQQDKAKSEADKIFKLDSSKIFFPSIKA